jgi:predicted esterase
MFLLTVKIMTTVIFIYSISFLFYVGSSGSIPTAYAQSDLQTTKHKDLVIDLGNNITTKAKLTYPAVGQGPYPGVLLIHGSGPTDMNETLGYIRIDNETGSKIYPPARPLFQIAEYLSDRGFAVLQYDKRGIGENVTVLNSNVWGNTTSNDLKQDAETALEVLIQQPEVDANKITLIGHSEGTTIAPRVAIDNPGKVDNIVLMGSVAQNMGALFYLQNVETPLRYAKEVLDHNHDGLLSVQEASENPVFSGMVGNITLLLTQNTIYANGTLARQPHSSFNTNNDDFISINDELKPALLESYKSFSIVIPGEKCTEIGGCPVWLRSLYAMTPTLDIIGKVSSDTSILIQQGENDSQVPIQQAFLLQQRLTEINHPDHMLKTYPGLGHVFYPSSLWRTSVGPIQENVLEDLFEWLSDPVRGFTKISVLSPSFHTQ